MEPAKSISSKTWDLSSIRGTAFTEVQEGVDVSTVVASALFGRQPDERYILSEFGKASQLFIPHEPRKEKSRRQDPLSYLMLSIRDALGLGEDFVPNEQLSKNRFFWSARQLQHLCATVMAFDVTLAIPDAWERWLHHHRHLADDDDELQLFLSFNNGRMQIPAVILRPAASLFALFEDARKLAEPRKEKMAAYHPHRMIWDACGRVRQLFAKLYEDDPGLRRAHGVPEGATKQKYRGISEVFFSSAYAFMSNAALKRKALENPPPSELLRLSAYMPRSPFKKINSEITRYLDDETDELPYATEKCSLENPLGLLTVSPKAHQKKHWCTGVVPVDLTDWPVFTALQERGFYRIDDPRSIDALELHRQVSVMALEVLGPEIWQ